MVQQRYVTPLDFNEGKFPEKGINLLKSGKEKLIQLFEKYRDIPQDNYVEVVTQPFWSMLQSAIKPVTGLAFASKKAALKAQLKNGEISNQHMSKAMAKLHRERRKLKDNAQINVRALVAVNLKQPFDAGDFGKLFRRLEIG